MLSSSVLDEDFRRKHGGWDFLVTNTSGVEQFFSTLLEQEIEFYGLKLDEEIGDWQQEIINCHKKKHQF